MDPPSPTGPPDPQHTTWLRGRGAELAPWVAGLVLAAPILFTYYPPMTDFAAHEALVALLRNFGDTTKYPPGLYVHNLGQTQQLFHLVAWALAYVTSVHVACKLVVAASLVAILVSVARLARHLGKTPWVALLVAPIAMGWTFYWGFVANLLGLACFFFALPALDDLAARPTFRRALVASAWCVLQYAAHEAPLFVLIGYVAILVVLRAPSVARAAWGLLPMGVSAALIVGQALGQEHLRSRANVAVVAKMAPLLTKVEELPALLLAPRAEPAVAAAIAVIEVGILVFFWTARDRAPRSPSLTLRQRLEAHRFIVLALASLFLYVVMPAHLNGATHVFERFLPLGVVILLVACAPQQSAAIPTVAKLALAAVPLIVVASALPQFAIASRIDADLDEVMTHIEPGSAVANLNIVAQSPSLAFWPTMQGSRVLTERGGRLLLSFADTPIAPVIIAPDHQWNESLLRNNKHPTYFRPAFDLRRYRYVLLCTLDPAFATSIPYLFRPEAEIVASRGPWTLLRSNITDIPLTAPDSRSPHPRPQTLFDRLIALGYPTVAGGLVDFDVDQPPTTGATAP